MAKKRVSPKQPELAQGEWGDKVPKQVQDAVDEYVEAKRAAAESLADRNRYYDEVITAMKKHGCQKVRVPDDDGNLTKMIELTSEDKLKIVKLKSPVSVGGGEDEENEDE